jgi:hypothetical protein
MAWVLGATLVPILMNWFGYDGVLGLSAAIANVAIWPDGIYTYIGIARGAKEFNPIWNALFRKIGLVEGLVLSRAIAFLLMVYAIVYRSSVILLSMGWLFSLAVFVGLSSMMFACDSYGKHDEQCTHG